MSRKSTTNLAINLIFSNKSFYFLIMEFIYLFVYNFLIVRKLAL